MLEKMKIKCWECNWKGKIYDQLEAPNPFERGETIYACPSCKDINSTAQVCDESECWNESTCGTPTKDGGYRRTCGEHKPLE